MASQFDFKKEWEKTKKQLIKISKEATNVAKRSEKEIVKFSQRGKLHIDSTAINLKKEHLYHNIGKEYVRLKDKSKPTARMNKYLDELKIVEKEQRSIKTKLKKAK